MSMNQPENPINTLRDVENRIDTLKGQITILDQEIIQMKKTRDSQEYTIGQNELRNKELIEFIVLQEKNKSEVSTSIKILETQRDSLDKDISDKKVELETLLLNIKEETVEIENNRQKNKIDNEDLEKRQIIASDKETRLNQKEIELNEKHKKIEAFKQSI